MDGDFSVITSLGQWASFLRRSDWLIGMQFVAVGLVLALAGWRLWKVAVVVTFAIIGWMMGTWLGGDNEPLMFGLLGAVLLGSAFLAELITLLLLRRRMRMRKRRAAATA